MIAIVYSALLSVGAILIIGSYTQHVSWTLLIGVSLIAGAIGTWMAGDR